MILALILSVILSSLPPHPLTVLSSCSHNSDALEGFKVAFECQSFFSHDLHKTPAK